MVSQGLHQKSSRHKLISGVRMKIFRHHIKTKLYCLYHQYCADDRWSGYEIELWEVIVGACTKNRMILIAQILSSRPFSSSHFSHHEIARGIIITTSLFFLLIDPRSLRKFSFIVCAQLCSFAYSIYMSY